MSETRKALLGRHIYTPRIALILVIIVSCLALVLSVSSCGTKTSATYSPPQEGDFTKMFSKDSLATKEDVTYERLMFLVRAPVGEAKQVTFKNPGDTGARTVTLTAVDDGMETLAFTNPFYDSKALKPQKMIEARTLSGNVGYVKIIAEADLPETMPGDHTPTVQEFKQVFDSFIKAKATGILIDFRGNLGGDDSMVTEFLSSFYKDRTLYEYQNWYNAKSGKMEIWLGSDQTRQYGDPGKSLDIVPGTPRYDGPIVAIVNTGCISCGEGVAMGVQNLPNGEVVVFWGTNGSFGMSGDEAQMPDGLTVSFPFGQSLDKDKVVQLDSRKGIGGVAPSKRIPMTLENALKWGSGQDIELEYALKTLDAMGAARTAPAP
jgi:carboxyl-terminal processing protease